MGGWRGGVFLAALVTAMPAIAAPVSDGAVSDFVDSHSALTKLGKIARWEEGVCPSLTGLPATFTKFIVKRIRDVAAQVGAPVNADENCKPNISIVFTTAPQGLLDNIRAKEPVLLGYYDSTAQAERMAKVTRTIQAWHATQTVDLRGTTRVDARNNVSGSSMMGANMSDSAGTRLGDGLHSSYYHATIVADPNKVGDPELGTLADHITMLALAQPVAEDGCGELPSILDMTNASCRKDAPVKALTVADMGYLRGLYKADPSTNLRTQKDAIAFHIKDALAPKP